MCLPYRGLAVLAVLAFPALADAQDAKPLRDLSLEELMQIKIETVVGVSERLQPVTEAPASVTIVTADDIARYGYHTLADILRSVRGLYVSDDRNYSYLGVRGDQPQDSTPRHRQRGTAGPTAPHIPCAGPHQC